MRNIKFISRCLFFILLCLALAGCFKKTVLEPENADLSQTSTGEVAKEEPVDVAAVYDQAVKEILEPYWAGNQVEGVKDRLLELHAPAEFLALHLNLVLAFELIEQGRSEADQAKIESGMEKLNDLREDYSWIGE